MKKRAGKRIIGILALVCSVMFSLTPVLPGIPAPTAHAATSLPANTKDGAIFHAFDWSFNTIRANLPQIAAAGFKSIQTSPVQGTKSSSTDPSNWWLLYQPTNQSTGNAQLGSLSDFQTLCSAADQYGISIIVDVVMNHMANNGNPDQLDPSVDPAFQDPSFYHNQGQVQSWSNRYDITQQGIGMPDLNTQYSAVQNKAIAFLNQLVDAGADGFRFDAAKHIETNLGLDAGQSWAGSYWTNVLGSLHNRANLFIYGEVLQDGSVDNVSAYESFMNVTASNYGGSVQNAVRSNNLSGAGGMGGLDPNRSVDFVETHDNYEHGDTSGLTEWQRKAGWAIVAARAGATPLYFDRPTGSIGSAGSTTWQDPDIAAINGFHNAMVGQNEYLRWTNNYQTMLIDRGTVGTMIVNDSSSTYVNSPTNLAAGTYTNHGSTSATLTVSGGTISGNIPAYSVIVLYGSSGSGSGGGSGGSGGSTGTFAPHAGYKVDYDSSALVQGHSFTVYYNGSLAGSSTVKLHWGINGWSGVTDTAMTKRSDGFWETTVTIPSSATAFNMVFTNGSSWDNNGGHDWNVPVWSGSNPVQVSPAPTAGKQVTISYQGSLAASASSMTLHWGYNGWTSPSDVAMTKQSNGQWTASITMPSGSYVLNMAFKSGSGTWDSNNSNNYNYSVSQ